MPKTRKKAASPILPKSFSANVHRLTARSNRAEATLLAAATPLKVMGRNMLNPSKLKLSINPANADLLTAGFVNVGSVNLDGIANLSDSWIRHQPSLSPDGRNYPTTVWTGSEMLIWGGQTSAGGIQNDGWRFNPSTGAWTPMTSMGAPAGRAGHTAVWDGSSMVIWGGNDGEIYRNDGWRYSPYADAWAPLSVRNAPEPRINHSAIWTGQEMIIWGGYGATQQFLNDGARYNPSRQHPWSPITSAGGPSSRADHSVVWTGNEMIVWGGRRDEITMGNGGRYNPSANSWVPVGPIRRGIGRKSYSRTSHTAIWTGVEMVVFGGHRGTTRLSNGGRFNPVTGRWSLLNSHNAPSARTGHVAVWSGSEMIIWGGLGNTGFLGDGARYKPLTETWRKMATVGSPSPRNIPNAVGAGGQMVLWGGYRSGEYFNDTYSYVMELFLYVHP